MLEISDVELAKNEQAKLECCGKIFSVFICCKCLRMLPERINEPEEYHCKDSNSKDKSGSSKIIELIKQTLICALSQEHLRNELKSYSTDMAIQSDDTSQDTKPGFFESTPDFKKQPSDPNMPDEKKLEKCSAVMKNSSIEFSTDIVENSFKAKVEEKIRPKCIVCLKSFSRKSTLAIHERIHRGEKPYQCQFCSKCFTCGTTLLRHERIHTGERPFQCKFCSKCFTQSVNLKSHEAIHTKEKRKGETPFHCSVCSKSYAHRSSLILHKRLHKGEKPYSCKCCSKSFAIRSSLTLHERIHTGEKPFSCKFCSKSFSDRSSIVKHERIHTGEKPFLCQFCSKSFTDRTTFVRHERIHKRNK